MTFIYYYFYKKIKKKIMANITLGGNPIKTSGSLPNINTQLFDFKLVATDLSTKTLNDFTGSKLVLNIFPSVNTRVCATSVRQFNTEASELENTKILCISRDLPFSQNQFCAAEGLNNVIMLSDFKTGKFGKDYGLMIINGVFDGLLSRSIIVADENGKILYTEQVPEIGQEPNYKAVLDVLYNE